MTSDLLKCMKCGDEGATLWTIHHEGDIAIVELCKRHDGVLRELAELGGDPVPPRKRKRNRDLPPSRVESQRTFTPLDWTPPEL